MTDVTTSGADIRHTDEHEPTLLGMQAARVRTVLWSAYALAVFVTLAALAAPRNIIAVIAGQAVWFVVAAVALVGPVAARRFTSGVERRLWSILALGGGCMLANRLLHAVNTAIGVVHGPAAAMAPSMFGAVGALGLVALLATLARFRHSSRAAEVRYVVDVSAACTIAAGALESWVVGPWFEHLGRSALWIRVLYAAAPVVGVGVLAGTIWFLLGTRVARWEPWERLVGLCIGAFSIALVISPLAYADVAWGFSGGWAQGVGDVIWLNAAYLSFAAAVYRHLGQERSWRLRPLALLEPSYGWGPAVLLPSLQVLAIPLLGLAALAAEDPATRMFRIGLATTISVMLALRTALSVSDREALFTGSVTDPLTGLYNHRHFRESLAEEIASARRYAESMALIEIDIDDLRSVNAAAGHAAGDTALVEVARAIEGSVRARDIVCRPEADEFAIVMPGADVAAAFSVALRVLAEIRRSVPGARGHRLTASAGVAAYPAHATDADELERRAKGALYWSKTHSRDRATVYDPDVVVALDADERIHVLRQEADLEAVRALAAAVDARDEATQDHSRNVARYAVLLAREIGMDDASVLLIESAALLHDVGKIGVPDAVLRRGGRLGDADVERMKAHAELGERILAFTTMREILPWVRHHHENWDGTGYPDGLAGEQIPLAARIIAIADAYDTLRTARPHQPALSRRAALQDIDLGLGTRFDPAIGERFIRLAESRITNGREG